MPPYRTWFAGREAVRTFLRKTPLRGQNWRVLPSHANGQVGLATYRVSEETGIYHWHSMEVITLRGDRIAEIIAFIDPESYAAFGMPPTDRRAADAVSASLVRRRSRPFRARCPDLQVVHGLLRPVQGVRTVDARHHLPAVQERRDPLEVAGALLAREHLQPPPQERRGQRGTQRPPEPTGQAPPSSPPTMTAVPPG